MKLLFEYALCLFSAVIFLTAEQDKRRPLGVPYFQVVTPGYPTESLDTTKLDVIIKIPYDAIQFLKKGSTFEAEYELSISLQDADDHQIEEHIRQYTVTCNRYRETISPSEFDLKKQTFYLQPDEYKCTIELTDMDTHKSRRQTITVNLTRFKEEVVLSDLLLIHTDVSEDDFPMGLPVIPSRITDSDSVFFIYYKVRIPFDEYSFISKIISVEDEIVSEETVVKKTTATIEEELLEHSQFDVPGNKFKLQLEIEQEGKTSQAELIIEVKWRGLTTHVSDLDEAIEQIRYIATRDELATILRARGEKREELFKQFWEKRDPSPNTPQNELMDEYFNRVRYANEKFGSFRDGWKTAMGRIFILFGPPDDIEINHFARDGRSYQRWHYYVINRSFVFVDYNGFGDYELLEPYSSPYGSVPR